MNNAFIAGILAPIIDERIIKYQQNYLNHDLNQTLSAVGVKKESWSSKKIQVLNNKRLV